MPLFLPNEASSGKRRGEIFVPLDDNVTAAPNATIFTGVKASRALSGLTGNLSAAILNYITVGTAGNGFTLALTNDGAGAGSLTNSGNNYTFHFQAGTTTINQMITAIAAVFTLTGTFTGTLTLQAGDVTTALTLAGGTDNAVFVRQGPSANYLDAAGILTNVTVKSVAKDGLWIYEFTQSELNHTGNEIAVMVDRVPDSAFLDLSTKTVRCGTIIYDKVAVGADGNAGGADPVTIAFLNDGAGTGTLNNSGAAWTFHYASGTTTVKNFEDAIIASSRFAIKKYGKWTNVLTHSGDTFTATNLAGGQGFKRPNVSTWPMRLGSFDNAGRGSNTYGDILRGMEGALVGKSSGYNSNPIVYRNPDDTKTVWTITRDSTGRTTVAVGDLTGP